MAATVPSTLADIVWPALYLVERMLSVWVILAGLVIEFFFVWQITELGVEKSIYADLLMNLASTVIGIILIPVFGLIVVLPFRATFGLAAWIATFCVTVLINTSVESLVLLRGFKQRIGKSEFCWLGLANALSAGAAFATFAVRPVQ